MKRKTLRVGSPATDISLMSANFEAIATPSGKLLPLLRNAASRLGHGMVHSRQRRVLCILIGVWLFNFFDYLLTVYSHRHGLLHELNPFASRLLGNGYVNLALFKFGTLGIASYPLLKYRSERIVEMTSFFAIGLYAFVSLQWYSCYKYYEITAESPDMMFICSQIAP